MTPAAPTKPHTAQPGPRGDDRPRSTQWPAATDPRPTRDRPAVECAINAVNHNRALATRYDKLAVRSTATIDVANIDRRLKRLFVTGARPSRRESRAPPRTTGMPAENVRLIRRRVSTVTGPRSG